MTIDNIINPIRSEMERFEPLFRRSLDSPNKLLSLIINYLLRRKGKQMRPMLVFLAARAAGEVTDATYVAATLIEMLHTATLIHDDVVDETYQRRGMLNVYALWNSKIAILVGDFLLARGMRVALDGDHFDLLKIVSSAVSEISEGELVQIKHAHLLDIDEATYYEVIRQKTATLIAACTRAGATSAGADATKIEALYQYGINLGIAFQIRDDIFDYEPGGLLGKPSGNDIKERKLTLPLIHALSMAPAAEAKALMRRIATKAKDDSTAVMASDFAHRYGGIDYARNKMIEYSNKAKRCLDLLPQSDARTALAVMVDYNIQRKK